tara:strand:+ start:502 stop:939 length:438 start_codon:yes stop_codon:yes gene_type:complete
MLLKVKDSNNRPLTIFSEDIVSMTVVLNDSGHDALIFESLQVNKGKLRRDPIVQQYEWWRIVKGHLEIVTEENTFLVKSGDHIHGLNMLPHGSAHCHEIDGKRIITFQPAQKIEEYFKMIQHGSSKGTTDMEWQEFEIRHSLTLR